MVQTENDCYADGLIGRNRKPLADAPFKKSSASGFHKTLTIILVKNYAQ